MGLQAPVHRGPRAFVPMVSVILLAGCQVLAESAGVDSARNAQGQGAHDNDTCIYYHELNSDEQCKFIQTTEDCKPDSGFVNYLEFTYCSFSAGLQPLALVILFVWLSFLFVCLGVAAKNFFCPALLTISKALKLSDNVAGVTFLAFGNGAPDVFSAVVAITNSKDGDAGLAIGALFGAAVFITTFVAGTISALNSFEVAQVPFLRDAIFVVGASYWTFYILYTGQIWTSEAVGFILLYIFYVIVVLVSIRFTKPANVTIPKIDGSGSYKRLEEGPNTETQEVTSDIDQLAECPLKDEQHVSTNSFELAKDDADTDMDNKCQIEDASCDSPEEVSPERDSNLKDDDVEKPTADGIGEDLITEENDPSENVVISCKTPEKEPLPAKRKTNFGTIHPVDGPGEPSDIGLIKSNEFSRGCTEQEPLLPKSKKRSGPCHQLGALFRDVNPIDFEGWKSKGYVMRAFEIFKSPIKLLLLITVPLVHHDKCSWNKPLNCLQLLVGPVCCVFITNSYNTVIAGQFYLWHLVLCLGALLFIIAFLTSKPSQPPVYYIAFAFLGFVISVCWIFGIANEIINLLRMYGIVFDLSDAILGLTFLALGNCIGDLVNDIAMAKQGAPNMAISACFGGPIFNMLIGIGVATTIATAQNGGIFKLKTDTLQFVLAAGLGISLFTSMFFMIAARFRATKIYAVLLYIFYAVFLTIAILTETKVIKW
ncbi:mitochondrial sodium/calcium exchanger protein-like [Acanthaster planci]|uniref:Mitochondrial sodium/calcium exchanger protein-like n=1 Tax=Acanthaster planci TaxID=133434 RepID=A0A8B7XNN8_ACAPL|nr:mitochondrial sodium/calcium exchanger protein-like [Acanthaster planci]